mmetsp:Transcript_11733/g.10363  ORF Transcript_11733/g.10363 Transcript_11733/m.10363 type:complete len:207 (+) Transcript_11733:2-622(+)
MFNNQLHGRSSKEKMTSDTILNRINSTKVKINETSINSAALQDHIMNSYNLGSLDPFRQKPKPLRKPSYLSKYKKKPTGIGGRALSNAGKNIMRTDSASSKVSIPKSRSGIPRKYSSYSNSKYGEEEVKVAKKPNVVYKTKNLLEKLNTETYIDIEKKREEYVNKLSLAQRRGLVAKPPLPLSQKQWKGIETKGTKRGENNDFCSI